MNDLVFWITLIALLVFMVVVVLIRYVNHIDDELERAYQEDMRALVMHSEEITDEHLPTLRK